MKRTPLLLALTILFVAACNLPTVTGTNLPSVPTIGDAATQPPGNPGNPAALTGTNWMWIGFTSPDQQVAVESPTNYSLVFQADGSVNITADCNHAQGAYQVNGQSIQIQVGAMTRSVCPPGSRSDEFTQYLGSAAAYSLLEGNLFIDLAGDGGTMVLGPSEEVQADQGNAALLEALQANPWQWISFANAAGQFDVETPAGYRLTFHENGMVDIQADCNNASGTYIIEGLKISILSGPVTLAACPAGSRSAEFLGYLGSAGSYFYQPGELYLNLAADGGTMRFTPVGTGN